LNLNITASYIPLILVEYAFGVAGKSVDLVYEMQYKLPSESVLMPPPISS